MEKDLDQSQEGFINNSLLDLSRNLHDHVETGNGPDMTMRPGKALDLLRTFNRHSTVLLHHANIDETIKVIQPKPIENPGSKVFDHADL